MSPFVYPRNVLGSLHIVDERRYYNLVQMPCWKLESGEKKLSTLWFGALFLEVTFTIVSCTAKKSLNSLKIFAAVASKNS